MRSMAGGGAARPYNRPMASPAPGSRSEPVDRTGAADDGGLRAQRRQQRLEMSRQQFLDAAEEVFARKGFHDSSIKEIAALAEYSVGAFYSFFETKDDVFVQIHERRGGEFMEGMRRVVAQPGSPVDLLHALADYEISFFREHATYGLLFLRTYGVTLGDLESKVDQAVADNLAEAMAIQTKVFSAGQEAGEIRDGDPAVLARLFSGLVSGFQSTDPVVLTGDPDAPEHMTLADFHEILDGAFGASATGRRRRR